MYPLDKMVQEEVHSAFADEWAIRVMIRRMVVADLRQRVKYGIRTEIDDLITGNVLPR